MITEQIRASYITSHYREQMIEAVGASVSASLNASLPQIPSIVIERAVAAAVIELDRLLSHPVQLQTETITITDHRP